VLLARGEEAVPADLPPSVGSRREGAIQFGGPVVPMRDVLRRYATWAYDQLGGQKLLTAEKLRIDIKTLRRWLEPEGEESAKAH
jgi:hypothetical protein